MEIIVSKFQIYQTYKKTKPFFFFIELCTTYVCIYVDMLDKQII